MHVFSLRHLSGEGCGPLLLTKEPILQASLLILIFPPHPQPVHISSSKKHAGPRRTLGKETPIWTEELWLLPALGLPESDKDTHSACLTGNITMPTLSLASSL